ncbi:MAG: hypothetical protein ACLURV_04285 [Gallintestinimicrobium sp.]
MRVATIPVGYADDYPRGAFQQGRCSDCRKARKDPDASAWISSWST